MYDFSRKQYILKLSSGIIWNIYCSQKFELYASSLSGKTNWSESVLIAKDIHESFYAEIDNDDNIDMLYQDRGGNIYFSILNNNGMVNTEPVLKSRQEKLYNKHFLLAQKGNTIHMFYIILHRDSTMLTHQTFSKGKAGTPRIIDYVYNNKRPYSVLIDKSSNMYVFYQSSDGNYLQMGYKKYMPSRSSWDEFTPVTRYNGNCEFPSVISDSRNVIHICYQRRASARQYELIYQQKFPDKNLWTKEYIIHTSGFSFDDASILLVEENIIVFWVREDIIYYSFSQDSGNTWSRPGRYSFFAGRQMVCISYKTNNPMENEKNFIDVLPGNLIRGVNLAFYKNASKSKCTPSAEDFKNMFIDTLEMLKSKMEELHESNTEIGMEIDSIKVSYQKLEKELVKQIVKMDIIENQLNSVKKHFVPKKTVDREWEVIKKEMRELKEKLAGSAGKDRGSKSTEVENG